MYFCYSVHAAACKIKICILTSLCKQDWSWEDREKVLRMLFAKINERQAKEKKQAELPPPSFDSDDDEVDNAAPLRGVANHAGPASLV